MRAGYLIAERRCHQTQANSRTLAGGTRFEQQGVALRAHLGIDLLSGDGIDFRLNLADRHAGGEDLHIRAEVGSRRALLQRAAEIEA